MSGRTDAEIKELVRYTFGGSSIPLQSIHVRRFPGETIVVVEVTDKFDEAISLANSLDSQIEGGFITVRNAAAAKERNKVSSVNDAHVTELIELLNARSRTSEAQPSLRYVQDASARVRVALTPRHHLVFGRRGVGKTALLLEARRLCEAEGSYSTWTNVQPLRDLGAERAFLTVALKICELPALAFAGRSSTPATVPLATQASASISRLLNAAKLQSNRVKLMVLQMHDLLRQFCTETQANIYMFLDDVHYLPAQDVPKFLDLIHGITRDNPVWIKAAAVRHQTRWFISAPPTGLQLGHDAEDINLDITLEDPKRARAFLEEILKGYLDDCGILSATGFLAATAIDRLSLASGGVPRDFLTLCASTLQVARQRENARKAGVQDANTAAGLASKSKLEELEADAAAARGSAAKLLKAFESVREFLLDQQQTTFFRIDFKDKEEHSQEYALVQSLMDLRMLHLLHSSLSARHEAGRRYEVYMLDLSQYSGQRLKRNLAVLDFSRDHLVLKKTRSDEPTKHGDTPRRLITILRGGPLLELSRLTQFK